MEGGTASKHDQLESKPKVVESKIDDSFDSFTEGDAKY
jgi:hypothetical protein